MKSFGKYKSLGETRDDAAGEAFDKGANLLGLGDPGGPAIDSVSRGADPDAIHFPRSRMRKPGITGGLQHDLCFSFSGLKTALMYYIKTHSRDQMAKPAFPSEYLANIAASYQEAIVDTLIDRMRLALNREKVRNFSAVGGVSFNQRLREKLANLAESTSTHVFLPVQKYCVDNAAMVGGLAGKGQGISGRSVWSLDACPNLEIGR